MLGDIYVGLLEQRLDLIQSPVIARSMCDEAIHTRLDCRVRALLFLAMAKTKPP